MVETKVVWSTVVALAVSIGIALLNAFQANSNLFGTLNPTLQALLVVVVPTLLVFLGGYQAPHTVRSGESAGG